MKRSHKCNSKTRRQKSKVVEDADRITKLPEPVLHHILSFLRVKDATRTCVLSKTWNSAFNSFPVMYFDQYEYFQFYWDDLEGFYSYVNNSIHRRCQNVSIQRFLLCVEIINQSQQEDVERWLNYAVNRNVEHLDLLYNNALDAAGLYRLPTSALFRAKSLKELLLSGCKLNVETGIARNIIGCFSLLKKLTLERSYIDEQSLQSLLLNSCTPSLEELRIKSCKGFRSVSLCSTKLKIFELHFYGYQVEKITVEAPNLRFLSLNEDFCVNTVLISSLDEASKYIKNLKELVLEHVEVTDAMLRVIREFGELEKLKLISCDALDSRRMSSYELPNLAVSDTTIWLKNGELIANCINCYNDSGHVKNGLYKLGIN